MGYFGVASASLGGLRVPKVEQAAACFVAGRFGGSRTASLFPPSLLLLETLSDFGSANMVILLATVKGGGGHLAA